MHTDIYKYILLYPVNPVPSFYHMGNSFFIVLTRDIIPVMAGNNLCPKYALEQTFQHAVLLVTSTLVADVVDFRPVACHS